MNTVTSPCTYAPLSQVLQRYLEASVSLCAIPEATERIALNFRHSAYLTKRAGPHPLEIHLFREHPNQAWQIATMTSFAFPYEDSEQLEVELYFNFNHQWFYQPDIKRCDLNQPQVIELFHSWQSALAKTFHQQSFDYFAATIIKTENI